MKSNKILVLLLKLVFAMTTLYYVFSKIPWQLVIKHLAQANKSLLITALTLQIICLIIAGLRTHLYFNSYGLKMRRPFAISLYCIGAMFNVLLPGGIGGDGYKVMLLWRDHQFSKISSLRIMLYERVNGFYPLAFLLLIFLPFSSFYYMNNLVKPINTICLLAITPCYFLGVKYILRDNIKTAFGATFFSIVIQLLQIISIICAIYAIDQNVSSLDLINYVTVFIVASIAAIFPVSIGGAGMREITFFYALELLGYTDISYGMSVAVVAFILATTSSLIGLPIWFYPNKSIK